jgi:hypothetical protein
MAQIQNIEKNAFDQVILSWQSPDVIRYEKGILWYAIAGLIDAALIAYSVWTSSWTMGAVFVILPIVYLLQQRKKPQMQQVILSAYGIKFGMLKFAYSDIQKFWILHEGPHTEELHLLTNNRVHPEVTISLAGQDPALIRNFLVTQVREWEGKKQSAIDMIVKILRLA